MFENNDTLFLFYELVNKIDKLYDILGDDGIHMSSEVSKGKFSILKEDESDLLLLIYNNKTVFAKHRETYECHQMLGKDAELLLYLYGFIDRIYNEIIKKKIEKV